MKGKREAVFKATAGAEGSGWLVGGGGARQDGDKTLTLPVPRSSLKGLRATK